MKTLKGDFMKDEHGKELSLVQLRKLLRRNSHPQWNWWHAKAKRIIGEGKPPPGVRWNKDIPRL
jgi:hypothetical protein